MCQNCKRTQVGQISASRGWCTHCMNAYKAGVKDGERSGYSKGADDEAYSHGGIDS